MIVYYTNRNLIIGKVGHFYTTRGLKGNKGTMHIMILRGERIWDHHT